MFNLNDLSSTRDRLNSSLSSPIGDDMSNVGGFRMGCDGCSGTCSGSCDDGCYGGCEGCGNNG